MLKRLLIVQCEALTGYLMVIVIGRCCIGLRGMGSSTPLRHIEATITLTNVTLGLYPLFNRALSKDLGSFASWMRQPVLPRGLHCSHSAHSPYSRPYCAS